MKTAGIGEVVHLRAGLRVFEEEDLESFRRARKSLADFTSFGCIGEGVPFFVVVDLIYLQLLLKI